jgi:hypothetical protein
MGRGLADCMSEGGLSYRYALPFEPRSNRSLLISKKVDRGLLIGLADSVLTLY